MLYSTYIDPSIKKENFIETEKFQVIKSSHSVRLRVQHIKKSTQHINKQAHCVASTLSLTSKGKTSYIKISKENILLATIFSECLVVL